MNLSFLVPFALLLLTFFPAFFEILRRRDRGPRAISEQTAEELPSETLEHLLREAEELLSCGPLDPIVHEKLEHFFHLEQLHSHLYSSCFV